MNHIEAREIAVFIASPGDLAPERKIFKEAIDGLNGGFADGAGVKFVPLGWEEILATTGRRTQDVINLDIDRCDLFVLALHRRWGQAAPDSKFSSYTEEEFQRATSRWKKTRSPEVLIFFKSVDRDSVADAGPELKKVLKFKTGLERGKKTLFRTFNTTADFRNEIDRHLRAFAKGEWASLDQEAHPVDLPKADIANLDKAARKGAKRVKRAEARVSSSKLATKGRAKGIGVAKADLSLVQAYQSELTLARAAAEAADDGRLQDATILFSKATEGTTNLSILALAAEFFRQMGDVENASSLVRRQAAIARDREIAARHYLNLLPEGWVAAQLQQSEKQMAVLFPAEFIDEINSVNEEIWGGGRLERFMLETYVKHFSTEELTQFARFLGTAEGQSSLQKQQLVVSDMVNFVAKEVSRVMAKRHPSSAQAAQLEDPAKRSLNPSPSPRIDLKQLPAARIDDHNVAVAKQPRRPRKTG